MPYFDIVTTQKLTDASKKQHQQKIVRIIQQNPNNNEHKQKIQHHAAK